LNCAPCLPVSLEDDVGPPPAPAPPVQAGQTAGDKARAKAATLSNVQVLELYSNWCDSSQRAPCGGHLWARHLPATPSDACSHPCCPTFMVLCSHSIKLASENKITAKNTWSLALIDHLSDLVKTEKDEDNNTNFQKASCTLDAGVKIYASRVDSVHTETFKVLGGLSRSATAQQQEEEEGDGEEAEEGAEGGGEDGGAKEAGKKGRRGGAPTLEAPEAHTSTTLESAVVVDPLFHKTSAQFDEGGAKGLLMHALSVHRGCDTVFDSDEVPDYAGVTAPGGDTPLGDIVLDCSALAPALARAQAALGTADGFAGLRFTPALKSLEALMPGAPRRTPAEAAAAPEAPVVVDVGAAAAAWADGGLFSCPPAAEEHAASAALFEDDMYTGGDFGGGGGFDDDDEEDSGGNNENAAPAGAAQGAGGRFRLGNTGVLEWVAAGGAEVVTRHAWAGASHWRFRAAPAAPGSGDANGSAENGDAAGGAAAKGRKAKKGPFTIDFTAKLPDLDAALFAPPTSKKESTVLVGERTPADTLLPADLRYTARQLTRLFLKPDASPASFGAAGEARDDAAAGGREADAGGAYDDDDGGDAGGWGDGGWDGEDDTAGYAGPVGDAGEAAQETGLLSAPRRVEKIQVKYARSAKVVDVRALKAALWNGLQTGATRSKDGSVSFGDLLEGVTAACGAGALDDLSVHMCFICVLHLANEHSLAITGAADLETMRVSQVL
jgi:condensin complex subunit 2